MAAILEKPGVIEPGELARAIEEYDRDGATVLRDVISKERVERLGAAVDDVMASGLHGVEMENSSTGRFFGDLYSWLHTPEIESFIKESGIAALAGQIMRSREVRFFYDQLLVKEPGTSRRTPWHQDMPYWPTSGEQVISFWVPMDAASPENGVVTYVKGSHRWNKFFPMEAFSDEVAEVIRKQTEGVDIYDDPYAKGQWGNLGDIRDHPEKYEFISWSVAPGDVVIHHPLTIHGAPGNLSQSKRRRAMATRWFGDDARWDDSRPHFMQRLGHKENFPYPSLEQGAPMDDPLFPKLWTDPNWAA